MKIALVLLAEFLSPFSLLFAHEGETEITNLAEAEWAGPLAAVLVITFAIFVARTIQKKSATSINGSNEKMSNNTTT